jgi:serine/threonine protein kinase
MPGGPALLRDGVCRRHPIMAYCDRHKLTVRQRMELFILVCDGVQHAHQKAIIHRDVKPRTCRRVSRREAYVAHQPPADWECAPVRL